MWDEYLRREQEYASRDPVPLRSATFHAIIQNRHGLRSVSAARSPREIVMASPRKSHRISHFAVALMPAAALLFADAALASQGPGGGPGSASPFTQLVMAIIVYGTSALLIGARLIGAGRRR
jgi:hypothetical protein